MKPGGTGYEIDRAVSRTANEATKVGLERRPPLDPERIDDSPPEKPDAFYRPKFEGAA